MSMIQDLPTPKEHGLAFNYAMWDPNTTITLANVPWNSDYRDIVKFDNQAGLDLYLNQNAGPVINITKLSYAKFGRPIRISEPFNAVQNYNYLRAHNPMQPIVGDIGRSFYYFIADVVYISPNTTEIYVQLDVWQTFGYGVSFGNCYIERGHVGIANENNFDNFGRDYLTTPEGLDLGNEYVISQQYVHEVASARFEYLGLPNYSVLVASNTALDEDAGDVAAPLMKTAKGSTMENLPNGAEIYLFNSMGHFKAFVEAMKEKPWVMQGIISIQAVPRMERYGVELESTTIEGVPVNEIVSGTMNNVTTALGDNWRDAVPLGRYFNLKKFLTAPYTVLEMTSYTGTPLVLKPECWQSGDMEIVEVPHFAPPSARLVFYPKFYNARNGGTGASGDSNGMINDGGEFLDMFTAIMNFPAFSVLNNGYMQFMASNVNGIAFQHQSADWSQTRALAGNSTSYDQASAGIELSKGLTAQGMDAATQSTNLANQTTSFKAMQAAANGFLSGARALDPLSAATGFANAAVSNAIDQNQSNQSLGIQNNLAAGQNRSQTDTAGYMRDTNKSLADWSANGDYQNQIAGINARVQDAKMTQPTSAGQVGGDAFNLATYKWGVDIKVKTLQPAMMNAIGEYWLRYGYAVNRFGRMPSSFMVCQKFTYWKLKETYITSSSCPENFKQVIRGIFEKGVTVWKNPNDIGQIDIADNAPLTGITL